ncbi:MAG: sodium:calcium antiporter [Planctomycetota bacterium]
MLQVDLTPALASLMPKAAEGWLNDQSTWLLLLFAAVAMTVVIKGADWLVEGAAGLAKKFGMPEVVIGATIVSLGTTSPEAAVSVLAAFSGDAGLAIGNGVGSIIADTGLIFGVGCLMTRLPADKFVLSRQGWVQLGSAVILAGLCYFLWAAQGNDATIPRIAGVGFVILLVGYLAISVKWAKQHPTSAPAPVSELTHAPAEETNQHAEHGVAFLFGIGLLGLALVIASGDVLVGSVTIVAERWNVPDAVIASTIVALGTSLPELVTGLTAIRKGHPEILVGNVIGADILNVLFVIGVSAVAADLPLIDPDAALPAVILLVMIPTMLIMLFFFRGCIFKATSAGSFSRWMGVPLVAMYVAYLVVSYVVSVE